MTRIARLASLGVISVALLACLEPNEPTGLGASSESLVGDFGQASILGTITDVHNATIIGDVGRVQDLHHYATTVNSFGDSDFLSFEVTVDTGDQAAMAVISISNLSSLDLVNTPDPSALGVSIVGCSGADPGVWDFDAGADEINYDLATNPDNPKEVTITYTALIPDWSAVSGGSSVNVYNPIADVPHFTLRGTLSFTRR